VLHIISINHHHRQPVPRVSTKSASTSSERKREKSIIECIFHQKEYHRAHISPYHLSRTPPSLLQAHPTLPLQVQTAPYLNVHLPPSFQSPLGSLTISESRLWHYHLPHIHPTALQCLMDGSSKSIPGAQQSHLNPYIRICVDHSPCPPPLAIATISYSSTITHAASLFESSQIRSRKHAPQPTTQI